MEMGFGLGVPSPWYESGCFGGALGAVSWRAPYSAASDPQGAVATR